jgi:hypothetical protein
MASFLFPKYRQKIANPGTLGTTSGDAVDFSDDTIKAALVRNTAYNPASSTTDEFFSSATVVSGVTNPTLGTKTVTSGTLDAADPTFTAVPSGAAIDWVLIYKDTGTGTTSSMIARLDLTAAVTPNGGDITVQFNASGIGTV